MKPEMKSLNQQHRQAMAEVERIRAEISLLESRLDEAARMESALVPTMATGDDLEALVSYRVAEAANETRRAALRQIKTDIADNLELLKHQEREAKFAANNIAASAWTVLTESLVKQHSELLRFIAQIAEKSEFNLLRWLREQPDLTPVQIAEIEEKEGFPQWL